MVDKVARFTGLSKSYVDAADMRIEIQRFCKELLRAERRTVGRLDSRFEGIDATAADDSPEFDPSMAAIRPPYTAALNDYVRRELGYKSDAHYWILGGGIKTPWDFGEIGFGAADVSDSLRQAFARNPSMKVFVASGYYDLATPFFATKYTFNHMGLDATQSKNISTGYYEAGHMMYIAVKRTRQTEAGRLRFHQDLLALVRIELSALRPDAVCCGDHQFAQRASERSGGCRTLRA